MTEITHPSATVGVREAASSDEELVRRVLAGETDAYASLVHRYLPVVERFLSVRGIRGADLDDVVQNAFVITYHRLARLRDPKRFSSYLLKVARNQKPPHRKKTVSLSDVGEPIDTTTTQDEDEALQAAIARLPHGLQVVLVLKYTNGMTAVEIADHLGQTVGSVTKSLSRAYQRLRNDSALAAPTDGD